VRFESEAVLMEAMMGEQVTVETEMKDATILTTALQATGMTSKIGKRKAVLSDGEATASLDFKTGRLTYRAGPMAGKIGRLRQLYAEAGYRAECERRGITVEGRTVDKDGNIVLMCSVR
jgi:hypothetical protein